MNILFLTNEYKHQILGSSGGTGNFIANFSKELQKKGHTVHVFGTGNKNFDFNDDDVIVHFERNAFKKNKFYKLLDSLTRKQKPFKKYRLALLKIERKHLARDVYSYIKKNKLKIDIIECHDYNGNSLFLPNTIPYVIRCHGSFSVLATFGYQVIATTNALEKLAMQRAKNFISISKYSQKINELVFGIKKMKLIYNGINHEKFKKVDDVAIIPKSIFFVGNLSFEKGADVAIQVFKTIQLKYPESSLHFIGIETHYKTEFEKIVLQNHLSSKVHYHGFLQTNEMLTVLSAAEIVIFPSKGETFGLALCETMSLKKCCVCSDLPSYNEIIIDKSNGFIAKTTSDYIEIITNVFDDLNLNNLVAQNARKTIVSDFNIDKMVAESVNYYQEIINNNL